MTANSDRLVRLHQIIGDPTSTPPVDPIIPVSKSSWYAGIAAGAFPRPLKFLGGRASFWRLSELLCLMSSDVTQGGPPHE